HGSLARHVTHKPKQRVITMARAKTKLETTTAPAPAPAPEVKVPATPTLVVVEAPKAFDPEAFANLFKNHKLYKDRKAILSAALEMVGDALPEPAVAKEILDGLKKASVPN